MGGKLASKSNSSKGVDNFGSWRCEPCLLGGRTGARAPLYLFLSGRGEERSNFYMLGPLKVVGGAVD